MNLVSLYGYLTQSGSVKFQIEESPNGTVLVDDGYQVIFGSGPLIARVKWALTSVQLFLGDSLIVSELFYLLILFSNSSTGIPHVCRMVS